MKDIKILIKNLFKANRDVCSSNKVSRSFTASRLCLSFLMGMFVCLSNEYANTMSRTQAVNSINADRTGKAGLVEHVRPHFYCNTATKVAALGKNAVHTTCNWPFEDILILSGLLKAMKAGKGVFTSTNNRITFNINLGELVKYMSSSLIKIVNSDKFDWIIKEWPRTYANNPGGNNVVSAYCPTTNTTRYIVNEPRELEERNKCMKCIARLIVNFNANNKTIHDGTFHLIMP